jgi:hypothetical protein
VTYNGILPDSVRRSAKRLASRRARGGAAALSSFGVFSLTHSSGAALTRVAVASSVDLSSRQGRGLGYSKCETSTSLMSDPLQRVHANLCQDARALLKKALD